jgi:hypothetical protein
VSAEGKRKREIRFFFCAGVSGVRLLDVLIGALSVDDVERRYDKKIFYKKLLIRNMVFYM